MRQGTRSVFNTLDDVFTQASTRADEIQELRWKVSVLKWALKALIEMEENSEE